MSWKDRLQENVILTSPEGTEFRPQWVGDPRSFNKTVAVFNPPGVKGASFQDLEFGAIATPLTIYFSGDDNDLEASRFFETCKEKGTWLVEHPVIGLIELQLSKVTEGISPVENGGVTRFDTEWLESGALEAIILSLPEKASNVLDKSSLVNDASTEQLEDNVDIDKPSLISKFAQEVADIADYVTGKLSALTDTIAEANSTISSVRRGITQTLSGATIDIEALAGQLQTLVQFPSRVTQDLITRLNTYSDMISTSFEEIIFPDGKTGAKPEDKNRAASQEIFLVSAMAAEAQIAVSEILDTRAQALEVVQVLIDDFNLITNNLDTIQGHFDSETMDLQYFSQSISYKELSETISLAIAYVLDVSFELAIEKRFIIDRPRTPIEIALTEYDGPGVDDENVDLFITSNNLHNEDILLLRAGTEVVVYV
jgi:prophage DNA circulation protein